MLGEISSATVVYAGAAPGTHVAYLSTLFPQMTFLLVDPAPFTVKETKQIRIVQDLFTDELATKIRETYAGPKLFVSDIRTADPDRDSLAESERKIKEDMRAQMRWHTLLGSEQSMLKFRLPWDTDTSEYLNGDIHLPVWGPQTTTESRLITNRLHPTHTRKYDHEKYEGQMFYFNTMTRVSLYDHSVFAPGLDHCYDCRAEVEILRRYLAQAKKIPPADQDVADMSRSISRHISANRTLSDPNPDKEVRKRAIKRKQYCQGEVPPHEVATLKRLKNT